MSRAFLVDRATGEVSEILVENDDDVRRYLPGDIYGKTLGKLTDDTAVRVWRSCGQDRSVELYSAYNIKTLQGVDLAYLPNEAKTELGVSI